MRSTSTELGGGGDRGDGAAQAQTSGASTQQKAESADSDRPGQWL